jgi:hypothetical protein
VHMQPPYSSGDRIRKPEIVTKNVSDKLRIPRANVKRRAPRMKGMRTSGKITD